MAIRIDTRLASTWFCATRVVATRRMTARLVVTSFALLITLCLTPCLTPRSFAAIPSTNPTGGAARGPSGGPTSRPTIVGLSHIALYVHDVEKSRDFYKKFLGFDEPFSLNNAD